MPFFCGMSECTELGRGRAYDKFEEEIILKVQRKSRNRNKSLLWRQSLLAFYHRKNDSVKFFKV